MSRFPLVFDDLGFLSSRFSDIDTLFRAEAINPNWSKDDQPGGAILVTYSRAVRAAQSRELLMQVFQEAKPRLFSLTDGLQLVVCTNGDFHSHFWQEFDAYNSLSEQPFDGVVFCPYNGSRGFVTIRDIHFVEAIEIGGTRTATRISDSPLARDRAFGFVHSNLREFVKEKTGLDSSRLVSVFGDQSSELILDRIRTAPAQPIFVVSACNPFELTRIVSAFKQVAAEGRNFIYHVSPEWIEESLGGSPAPKISGKDLVRQSGGRNGLWLVECLSDDQKAGMADWTESGLPQPILVDVTDAVSVEAAISAAQRSLSDGEAAVLLFNRGGSRATDAFVTKKLSEVVAVILQSITVRPAFVVSALGPASGAAIVSGLEMDSAETVGEVEPGVAVWQAPQKAKWPGMHVVHFPFGTDASKSVRLMFVEIQAIAD